MGRVGRLGRFGEEAREWSLLLTLVIKNMIKPFENPNSGKVKDFWFRAYYKTGSDRSGANIKMLFR